MLGLRLRCVGNLAPATCELRASQPSAGGLGEMNRVARPESGLLVQLKAANRMSCRSRLFFPYYVIFGSCRRELSKWIAGAFYGTRSIAIRVLRCQPGVVV